MTLSKSVTSATVLALVGLGSVAIDQTDAAVIFQSDFTGTNNTILGDSPDWAAKWDTGPVHQAILSNHGYFTNTAATGFHYAGVQAEISGSPALFDPSTSNEVRFQIDLSRALDTRALTSGNIYFVQYLSPTNFAVQPNTTTSERLALWAIYNKNAGTDSTVSLTLRRATAANTGAALWTTTLTMNGTLEQDDALATDSDIQLAIELRNDAAGDVRAGYQRIDAGVAQGWNYSNWFDVESGTQAFAANWASNWANQTKWYLEMGGAPQAGGGAAEVYVDDAVVTQVPEPAALSLLGLGSLALRRRK